MWSWRKYLIIKRKITFILSTLYFNLTFYVLGYRKNTPVESCNIFNSAYNGIY